MSRAAKPPFLACLSAILFISALAPQGQARAATVAEEAADETDPGAADRLGAQVREIARSPAISREKKAKRISTVVRIAVVTATSYKRSPDEALAAALDLTSGAARAAPSFAEVIANAVFFSPAVSRIEGASARVRMAAFAAAKSPDRGKSVRTAVATARPTRTVPAKRAPARRTAVEAEPPRTLAEPVETAAAEEPMEEHPAMVATREGPSMGRNSNFTFTATAGVRHDDNVYLSSANEVSDTIYTLTPGVAFQFGQEALAHGSFNYSESFLRYADKTSPNVSLGNGAADFGYDNGSFKIGGNALFQQLNQNTSATAAPGQEQRFRRDVLDLGLQVENLLSAKTRLSTGATMHQLKYKQPTLIGTRETSVPVKVYLETTPKTSVGVGATYRAVKPDGAGPSGHDLYYNVNARGEFTAKLSGDMSVGYRTREVAANPRENLWGFDGSLHYAMTLKSALALQLSRDFSTGALGESLTSNRYALRFMTEPTPQWSFGATLAYEKSGYGPTVFSVNNAPVATVRDDNYWEATLQASYLVNSWLTASADYTRRNNQSTRPDAEYSNNQFNLTLGVHY